MAPGPVSNRHVLQDRLSGNQLLGSPEPRTERDMGQALPNTLPRLLGHQMAAPSPHRNPQSPGGMLSVSPALSWGRGQGEPPSHHRVGIATPHCVLSPQETLHALRVVEQGWGLLGWARCGQPGGLCGGGVWPWLGSQFGGLVLCFSATFCKQDKAPLTCFVTEGASEP